MAKTLQTKALKVTAVLDPAAVATIPTPNGVPKVELKVAASGRTLAVEVNTKSLRRVIATINEVGPDGVAVIVQGKLEGDVLTEAGIVAQMKTPKPAAGAAT